MPRTQRSVTSTVRSRAGTHLSKQSVSGGSRLCAAAWPAAARPGHERAMCRKTTRRAIHPPPRQPPLRKNIPLYRNSELRHTSRQPGPTKRGGSRVVRNAGRVAVDAAAPCARGAGRAGRPCEPEASCGRAALKSGEASWRRRMSCVRQNRVVLAVVATVKLPAEMCASPTGRTASSIRRREGGQKEVRLPGEHGISRQTIAQGRPGVRPHLYAAVQSLLRYMRTADRGCQAGTRPSLRPLSRRA